MRVFAPGLELVIPLTITPPMSGAAIVSFTYTIYDKTEQVIQASASGTVVNGAAGSVTFNAGILANTLAVGESMGVRWVKLNITYADNSTATSDYYYGLQVGEGLVIGLNSFLTYTEAEFVAHWIPNLDGWLANEKQARITALAQAREDLCRLTYRYDPANDQTRITETPGMFSIDLREQDATELAALPADFTAALKRAQVIQANYLMSGSTTEKQREDGLMSRTVGESSEMYRPGMGPIRYPVCREAMVALSGYLEMNRWMIGRG